MRPRCRIDHGFCEILLSKIGLLTTGRRWKHARDRFTVCLCLFQPYTYNCRRLDGKSPSSVAHTHKAHEMSTTVRSRCVYYPAGIPTHLPQHVGCTRGSPGLPRAWFGTHINSAKGGSLSRMHRRAAALAMGHHGGVGLSPWREIAGGLLPGQHALPSAGILVDRAGRRAAELHPGHEKQCTQSRWRQRSFFDFGHKTAICVLLTGLRRRSEKEQNIFASFFSAFPSSILPAPILQHLGLLLPSRLRPKIEELVNALLIANQHSQS